MQSFSQHFLREIVEENNNCAVARTYTVEVLARLIGTLQRWGAGPNHRGEDGGCDVVKSLINPAVEALWKG